MICPDLLRNVILDNPSSPHGQFKTKTILLETEWNFQICRENFFATPLALMDGGGGVNV